MDVSLRKAAKDDEHFLLRLRKLTMIEHLESAGIFLSDDEHMSRTRDDFDCANIIECAGRPVGLMKYRESREHIEIMQLQVLPEHQGKGIGRQVMKPLIRSAKLESKRLVLTVLKGNPAKRLYERLGFRVVGEDEHEFHMQFVAAATPAERTTPLP